MEQLETKDIQGLILKGYSNLPAADFYLLSIIDIAKAKVWLKNILPQVTHGLTKPQNTALNIAFTFNGIKLLGLDEQGINSFPMQFEDGMITPHTQQMLGDYGSSDPKNWEWGKPGDTSLHAVLMLYGSSDDVLNAYSEAIKLNLQEQGFQIIQKLDSAEPAERKEHFGFHDGIAQPTIEGLTRKDVPENTVAAGEFILGYKNGYNQYPDAPTVNKTEMLPLSVIDPEKGDLGRNGSFMVFRQIRQNVSAFWQYMNEKTKTDDGKTDEHEMIKLASKMVGRWPSGAPLVLSAEKDAEHLGNNDHFGYRSSDPEGMKCPYASHVRRTNPRDSIDADLKTAVQIANRHRIIRRGRYYGAPLVQSMQPMDMLNAPDDKADRGLHFICFNADLGRQFEFVQGVWINNPKFNGMYEQRDPLAGNHSNPSSGNSTGTFAMPEEGLRSRLTDVPEFVTTIGGAYFFMPGIKALEYLASI